MTVAREATAIPGTTTSTRDGGVSTSRTRRRRRGWTPALVPWLFLAPALLLFLYFKFIPMAEGIRLSLYKVQPFLGDIFVGMKNYATVLNDAAFQDSAVHTLVLAFGQTLGSMVVGFFLALLLEGQARSLWFVRSAVFLPVVAATAVIGEIWRVLYFPDPNGFANHVLSWIGLGPSQFLDSPNSALISVMLVGIWKNAPYDMVLILAGLASIPREQYEAAAIDGTNVFQRLWYVTLPALRPVVTILLTLAAIRGLRVFTEVYVLTGGGPAGATSVWMTTVFSRGFEKNDIGVASAASVMLFLVTFALTVIVQVWRRAREAR
ncbi:multiple sugar transport system permease protein [Actinocrispum wychmicini]|uniref:Multiple sugar transport system permease protein n=1 Tax=Actinocrispum wychmicini TaxID=1213861 RepID=A0A4R2JE69_9PSEU|nr:multiple sugar transport system permease protein [Actinocrispum wychmicini]